MTTASPPPWEVATKNTAAHLGPTRTLLEAIPDFLRGFTDGQVLLHVAALPLALSQLHAQGIILRQRVLRRPPALLKGVGTD